jgi:hypothetical protein
MIRLILIFAAVFLLTAQPVAAQSSTYALIVSSASGNSEFKEKFWNWSSQMALILKDEMRIPRENIVLLTEDPSINPTLVNGKATKAELAKAFDGLVAKCPLTASSWFSSSVTAVLTALTTSSIWLGPTPPRLSSRAGWTASRNAASCWSAARRAAEY